MAYSYDDYEDRATKRENAARLADGMVSRSGKVLGGLLTLPEPIAIAIRGFQPWLIGKLADFGQEPATRAFTAAARTLGSKNAEQLGGKLGKGTALVLPYTLNLIELAGTAREHVQEKKSLLASIEPLLKANKEAHKSKGAMDAVSTMFDSGYSDNKMITHALSAIKDRTLSKLSINALNVVPSFVVNYGTNLEGKYNEARLSAYREGVESNHELIDLEKKLKTAEMLKLGAGGLSEGMGTYMDKKAQERTPETSLDKVQQLAQMIRENDLDSPSSVASDQAMQAVSQKVAEIFQTYQKEQKHRPIASHGLQDVSNKIAKELIAGDLHALSLVNIVGREELLTESKDRISSVKVDAVLAQETAIFSKNSTITSEDFLKDHGNFTFDDIKAHLQSKNMDERALAVLLVPDSVAIEAGAKKEEIKGLRAHLSKKMQEGVYTHLISSLALQTDEQLEEKGFSREAIVFVREHDGPGAESPAHAMKSKAGEQQLKNIALDALMGEESTAWRDTITHAKAIAVRSKGPAANDESAGPVARRTDASNDDQYMQVANGSHAAKVRAAKEQQAHLSK